MGIKDICKIPIVISDGKANIASYNPRTDVIFINSAFASEVISQHLQERFACPDNPLSTIVHELFRWQDAYEYRQEGGTICDSSTLRHYTIQQREICRQKLLDCGVNLDDMREIEINISRYARSRALENEFDEVYAEYRTRLLLEKLEKEVD